MSTPETLIQEIDRLAVKREAHAALLRSIPDNRPVEDGSTLHIHIQIEEADAEARLLRAAKAEILRQQEELARVRKAAEGQTEAERLAASKDCPAQHGDQCCGFPDVCRAVLREGAAQDPPPQAEERYCKYKPAWDEINRVYDEASALLAHEPKSYLGWNWVYALVDALKRRQRATPAPQEPTPAQEQKK